MQAFSMNPDRLEAPVRLLDDAGTAWQLVKDDYKGPGGGQIAGRYLAHEFRADADRRMLYLEEHC